jgi:hypothetical protein
MHEVRHFTTFWLLKKKLISSCSLAGLKHLYCNDSASYESTRYRKKPQFGSRLLKDKGKVFDFNAW